MSEMECSSVVGSDSIRSFEEFDVVNDCYNNMVCDDTNEVSCEETEVVAPEFDEIEEMSLNSCDLDDFAVGAAQSEASSWIENDHFNDSEHLDINNAAGRALVELKEEGNPVEELPGSDHSLASSEFSFTPLQLSRIASIKAQFEALNAGREYFEFFKEEEILEVNGSDVVLSQDSPISDASSDFFTASQLLRIKAINDAYIAMNEEKEMKAMEALLLAEMSITQCTGYGAINGNFVVNRVIEGLLPKINSNQLTQNWLLNEENIFETIPF